MIGVVVENVERVVILRPVACLWSRFAHCSIDCIEHATATADNDTGMKQLNLLANEVGMTAGIRFEASGVSRTTAILLVDVDDSKRLGVEYLNKIFL